jgi:hypothetical protein
VLKLLTIFFLGLTAGFASAIQFTTLPSNTEYGTYNGFVPAFVDGSPNHLLVCDDYEHTTYVPSGPLQYNVSTVDSLAYARFTNQSFAVEQAGYEQATLLADGLAHSGTSQSPDLTADYQYALWRLFTPGVVLTARQQSLFDMAAADVKTNPNSYADLYSRLRIYTPTQQFASNQEFLELADAPEPSAGVLLAIGGAFILVSCAARRRLKRSP